MTVEEKKAVNTAEKLVDSIDKKKKQDNLKLRKSNVVWTVSGDYSYMPVINLFDRYDDYDMDFYRMMLMGYVYKKLDMDEVFEYISVHMNKTEHKNEFLKFVEIFMDLCYSDGLVRERPGAEKYRKLFTEKLLKKLENGRGPVKTVEELQSLSLEEQMSYCFYSLAKGRFLNFETGMTALSLYAFMRKGNYDTDTFINRVNEIFLKYFFVNAVSSESEKDDRIPEKEEKRKEEKNKNEKAQKPRLNFRMKKKNADNMKGNEHIGSATIESAEFTKAFDENEKIDDERLKSHVKPSIVRSNDKIRDMITGRYGASMYSNYITDTIERELCTDIHEGIKIHFTEGKFVEGKYDRYFAKSVEMQRERNLEYYKDNELMFRRSINQLRDILLKKINLEEDDESSFSNSGKLVVNRIWRNRILNEDRIFKKTVRNELGSISVDILLDSSASQIGREPMVSSQAFVIAEAFTSLNIPTRVMGFCNFFNFLVLTQYRDYNDTQLANSRIFNYKASGSNRDGLAIKVMSSQMDVTEYEKKVLIVLSDGRPNDKIDLGTVGFFEVDGQNYENEDAVMDTAQEVFNMKLRGKYPLGVFTGLDEDLEQEKKIYGKDFAYIREIERFSQVIGFYIENLIN